MGAPTHSGSLKIPAKMRHYGRWGVVQDAKTTDFPGGDALAKKRGSGTGGRKMRILAEKRDPLWFSPPETTRIFAETEPNDVQNL
jgi:hypothetical protein